MSEKYIDSPLNPTRHTESHSWGAFSQEAFSRQPEPEEKAVKNGLHKAISGSEDTTATELTFDYSIYGHARDK